WAVAVNDTTVDANSTPEQREVAARLLCASAEHAYAFLTAIPIASFVQRSCQTRLHAAVVRKGTTLTASLKTSTSCHSFLRRTALWTRAQSTSSTTWPASRLNAQITPTRPWLASNAGSCSSVCPWRCRLGTLAQSSPATRA